MPQTLKEAYPTPEALEKFKANFETKWRKNKDGCWIWTARRDADDYGQVSVGTEAGRIQRAHRVAYELYTGEAIPEGMDVDHLCHIRRCVNVSHLEVVTHNENMQRLRGKEEDWLEDRDDSLPEKRKTSPQQTLELAKALIEKSEVKQPERNGNDHQGYALATVEGAPWREMAPTSGYLAKDKFALIYIFLECVRRGVRVEIAAPEILGLSPFSLKAWLTNGFFREDLNEARAEGRKYRLEVLEDMHLDVMERKIEDADFKDVSNSLTHLRDSDPATKKAAAAAAAAGAPTIAIIINGNSVDVLKQVAAFDEDEIIEGEAREIE